MGNKSPMSFAAYNGWTLVEGLMLIERELLLFTLFWFVIGMVDEMVIDAIWIGLRLNPEYRTQHLPREASNGRLDGRIAIFVACWREADVIGVTVANMLNNWEEG